MLVMIKTVQEGRKEVIYQADRKVTLGFKDQVAMHPEDHKAPKVLGRVIDQVECKVKAMDLVVHKVVALIFLEEPKVLEDIFLVVHKELIMARVEHRVLAVSKGQEPIHQTERTASAVHQDQAMGQVEHNLLHLMAPGVLKVWDREEIKALVLEDTGQAVQATFLAVHKELDPTDPRVLKAPVDTDQEVLRVEGLMDLEEFKGQVDIMDHRALEVHRGLVDTDRAVLKAQVMVLTEPRGQEGVLDPVDLDQVDLKAPVVHKEVPATHREVRKALEDTYQGVHKGLEGTHQEAHKVQEDTSRGVHKAQVDTYPEVHKALEDTYPGERKELERIYQEEHKGRVDMCREELKGRAGICQGVHK
ncbi:hypothetical protein JYU34_000473 [Plutella xylostella]|uniref:Uncharacterized protein n=1 Tax=Plutella xylostella TaxID=51655 RepID=A0ABQ7R7U8_PLUXY|nr:hypothetical protein JYU34_000473 [Plutella xylostella]